LDEIAISKDFDALAHFLTGADSQEDSDLHLGLAKSEIQTI
jgi:hypothetical protein